MEEEAPRLSMNKLRKKFGVKVGESMDTNLYNTNRLCLQCYVSTMLRTLASQNGKEQVQRIQELENQTIEAFLSCVVIVVFYNGEKYFSVCLWL